MTDNDDRPLFASDKITVPVTKFAAYMFVPDEVLRDCQWRPATPEDRAEQDRQRAAVRTDTVGAHARLLADVDGLAHEILTLHAPTYDTYRAGTAVCEGCDVDGHGDQEQPYWPCRTYRLVAEHHGRRFVSPGFGARMETVASR